ncbi:hypothetical protein Hdeb2414_s0008g00275521 [Helianthus debilis subsp. tardiflorus]
MAGKLTKNRPQISLIHHHHNYSQPIPDLISYQISPYHYYFGRIDRFQEGGTSRNHSRSMLPWSLTSRSSMSCVMYRIMVSRRIYLAWFFMQRFTARVSLYGIPRSKCHKC